MIPRVLHVVRRLGYGGLEVGVINLVRGLERHGFAQAVCCLEERGELAGLLPPGVPVFECSNDGRDTRWIPWRAARQLRAWRPDVVHARNGWAWIDATAAWLLSGRQGRLVFSVHGWDRLDRLPPRRAWLFRRLAQCTRTLAAVSAETARQFARETGIPFERFRVLSSGVDTDRFRPSAQPHDPARVVIGCVGRLDPVKAHDLLIDAFSRIPVGGAYRLELQLLGDGPCRSDLERLVRERGLEDRVHFLGMVSDIPERLRELDIFVLSSHREGRPTSIMEAMASGLPVVATRVGSVPELVSEERTGLLVEPGDPAGLARSLQRLVEDEPLRRRLADAARRVAVSELSIDRMVEQYAALYRQLAPV